MIKDYQKLKETISNIISNSNLDIGVVYFILKDIYRDVENLYYNQINKEIIEQQKTQLNTDSKDMESENVNTKAEE